MATAPTQARRLKKTPVVPVEATAFSLTTIAEALDLSYYSVEQYVSRGELRAFKTRGGWRVTYAEYMRFYQLITNSSEN